MTEATRTRKALAEVQLRWPRAVIYKINDRTTKGIPDVQILLQGLSVWAEFKDANKETVEQLMATPRGKLQLHELQRIAKAGGTALVVVFRGKVTEIYSVTDFHFPTYATLEQFLIGMVGA